MSAEPSEVIAVFDTVASRYDHVGVDFFTPIGAELVRRAGIAPGDRVLDVGCGRGAVLIPAAAAAGPTGRVTGTDLAPAMVRLTAEALAGLPTVTVSVGDAQAPDFPPASFDVITAGLVLFFLPDPPAALAAYRSLLRPGGRLAFSAFAGYDPRYPRAMQALARHTDDPQTRRPEHELFKSEPGIRTALAAAGYADVQITPFALHSRFRDTEHWLDWVRSHAGEQTVRRIPAERLPAALADAAAELARPGEPLELTTSIRIVRAQHARTP